VSICWTTITSLMGLPRLFFRPLPTQSSASEKRKWISGQQPLFIQCYCLDLLCPLKGPCAQGWPMCSACGTIRTSWKEVKSLGVHPWRASQLPWSEQLCLPHVPLPPTLGVLPHHRPKGNGPIDPGLKPPKPWAKVNLSSCLSKVFCHSNGKLVHLVTLFWLN
jgi:hypothetical protein